MSFDIFDSRITDIMAINGNNQANKALVYIADMENYTNHLAYFWRCISVVEKEQAQRYYTQLLTNRYIISHGILRYILSYHSKQPPSHLEFTNNEYGKPFLKDSNIQFNMSHSHNMACYIVAWNNKVGIDVEFHNDRMDIMELLKLVLTPSEMILFSSIPPQDKLKTFYNIWTKKESLIKATGEGLSYPIATIEALSLASGNKIALLEKDNNFTQELYSYKLNIAPNYSGAMATEHKVDKIVYLEVNNQHGVFDKVRSEYLTGMTL